MSKPQREYVRTKAILLAFILEPPSDRHLTEMAWMDFDNAQEELHAT
jgi:hypothetical protein